MGYCSPRVPSQAEIESLIEKAKSSVKLENLWINPDCGLKTRELARGEKHHRTYG